MRPSGHPTFRNWLSGLVAGTAGGFLVLVFPTLGLALIGLAVIGVLLTRPRLAGASGLLVGIAATTLILLIRASLACEAFDASAAQGCVGPDIAPFLALGGGLLAAGMLLSAVAFVRGRQE